MANEKPKKIRKGRIALYGDDSIFVSATMDFGRSGFDASKDAALRRVLDGAEDEDGFFFACVDAFEGVAGGAFPDGGYVATKKDSWKAAPFGFVDMVDERRPFPAVGVVVAANASTRDLVGAARATDGTIVAFDWKRGETVAFENGRIRVEAARPKPAAPEGKVIMTIPYKHPRTISDGTTLGTARCVCVDLVDAFVDDVNEADFPLVYVVAEETFKGTVDREIRWRGGKFYAASSEWSPADERTSVEDYEREFRLDIARNCRTSKPFSERSWAALEKAAAAKGTTLEREDLSKDSARARIAEKLAGVVAFRGEIWTEIGEPRYVVHYNSRHKRTTIGAYYRSAPAGEFAEFPATTPLEEVADEAEKIGKLLLPRDQAIMRCSKVTVVDPTKTTVKVRRSTR